MSLQRLSLPRPKNSSRSNSDVIVRPRRFDDVTVPSSGFLMTSPSLLVDFLDDATGPASVFDDVIVSCAFGDVTVPSLGLDDVVVLLSPFGDVTVPAYGSDFVTFFSCGFGDVNIGSMTSYLKSKKTSSAHFSRYYVRSEWIPSFVMSFM
jgi:hypothetical protein